jgi:hypothetical protein
MFMRRDIKIGWRLLGSVGYGDLLDRGMRLITEQSVSASAFTHRHTALALCIFSKFVSQKGRKYSSPVHTIEA